MLADSISLPIALRSPLATYFRACGAMYLALSGTPWPLGAQTSLVFLSDDSVFYKADVLLISGEGALDDSCPREIRVRLYALSGKGDRRIIAHHLIAIQDCYEQIIANEIAFDQWCAACDADVA